MTTIHYQITLQIPVASCQLCREVHSYPFFPPDPPKVMLLDLVSGSGGMNGGPVYRRTTPTGDTIADQEKIALKDGWKKILHPKTGEPGLICLTCQQIAQALRQAEVVQ